MSIQSQHLAVLSRKRVENIYQTELKNAVVGHWALDESSGAALDSGPNGFDLTDNNTVQAATGQVGGGRDFELDNSEYFSHADHALLSPSGDFTIIACQKLETTAANKSILNKYTNPSAREYALYSASKAKMLVSNDGTALSIATSTGDMSAGVWYMVVGQHIDGVSVRVQFTAFSASVRSSSWDTTAHTTGVFSGTSPFYMGGWSGAASQDAVLDEVGLYDSQISEAALDEYFLQLKSGVGLYGTWT